MTDQTIETTPATDRQLDLRDATSMVMASLGRALQQAADYIDGGIYKDFEGKTVESPETPTSSLVRALGRGLERQAEEDFEHYLKLTEARR